MNAHPSKGVVLPEGHTGSSLFHSVLQEAQARFPEVLQSAGLPHDARRFKRGYREALVRFEACRTGSTHRVEIARFLVQRTQAALRYGSEHGVCSLAEHLQEPVPEPALEQQRLPGVAGFEIDVPFEGKRYRGRELGGLIERLEAESALTAAASAALRWIVEHVDQCGGRLDLRGQRFAVLGAGAELAPTRMLLRAGASVLWVDLTDPERALGPEARELAGNLMRAPTAANLLEAPRAVVAAVEAFAQGQPVHLGLFAYASGSSREWRLAATMNAIATRLDPALVRSVSMLVSPTTAASVQPETAAVADQRALHPVAWQRALRRVGLLGPLGYYAAADARIARAAVSIQGLSYQAAQYISKLAAAETFAVHGTGIDTSEARPCTVSANVAGITRTRSLRHPLFQAAFIGAPSFGVRIFEPATTRALSGLLILHDLLNPNAPGACGAPAADARDKAQRLLSQQVHGGIYALPYALESAIRIAALIGLGSRPSLLLGAKAAKQSARVVASAASAEASASAAAE